MHVNKVDRVTTVERVAERLGESVDFIHDVALEMDTEDGVIWVYGIGDDGVLASTVSAVSIPLSRERKNSLQFIGTRHCKPLAQCFASD